MVQAMVQASALVMDLASVPNRDVPGDEDDGGDAESDDAASGGDASQFG